MLQVLIYLNYFVSRLSTQLKAAYTLKSQGIEKVDIEF